MELAISPPTFTLQGSTSTGDWGSTCQGQFVYHPLVSFFLLEHSATNSLKALSSTASVLASASHSQTGAVGVALTDTSLRVAIAPASTGILTYDIQVSSPTLVAFNLVPSRSSLGTHSLSLWKPVGDSLSPYLYVIATTSTITMHKFDLSSLAAVPAPLATFSHSDLTKAYTSEFFDASTILLVGNERLYLFATPTMSLVTLFAASNAGYLAAKDPPGTAQPYFYFSSLAFNTINKAALTASTLTSAVKFSAPATVVGLKRIAGMQLMIYFADLYSFAYFIKTNGMTSAGSVFLDTFLQYPQVDTLVIGEAVGSKSHRVLVSPNQQDMFVYRAVYDFCGTPDQDPCTQCTANRYLDSSSPDNYCLMISEFPKNYGPKDVYYLPCLNDVSLGCNQCPADYSSCQICDVTGGFYKYLNPATSQYTCVTVPTMPDQFGRDLSLNVAKPCNPTGCKRCAADITVCTECMPGLYLKEGTTNPCLANTQTTWGLKTINSTVYLGQCSVARCRECRADYSRCELCTSWYSLIEGRTDTCIATSTPGFVQIILTPSTLRPCSANCLVCSAVDGACKKCGGNLIFVAGQCQPFAYITIVNSPRIDSNTGLFTLAFSASINSADYISGLTTTLLDRSEQPVAVSQYTVTLSYVSPNLVAGVLATTNISLADLSSLVIRHSNVLHPVFTNGTGWYDGNQSIVILVTQVLTSPEVQENSISTVGSTIAKAGVTMAMGAAIVSGSNSAAGSRISALIKIIDNVEYVLYLNGVRVLRAD